MILHNKNPMIINYSYTNVRASNSLTLNKCCQEWLHYWFFIGFYFNYSIKVVNVVNINVVNESHSTVHSIYMYNVLWPGIFAYSRLHNKIHTHCAALVVIDSTLDLARWIHGKQQCSCVRWLITLTILEFPHNDNRS